MDGLQPEADSRIACESLHVGDPAEHDRRPPVVGFELVGSLPSRCERVLERVGSGGCDVGCDDRTTGEGDLDPN